MRPYIFPFALLTFIVPSGCSLSLDDIKDCESNSECRSVFGLGAFCQPGGFCETTELHPRCSMTDPVDLSFPIDSEKYFVVPTLVDHNSNTHVARYRSIQLALDQANRTGGLGGREFASIHCTYGEEPEIDALSPDDAAVEVARWLANEVGSPLLTGLPSSGRNQIVFEAISSSGMMMFAPSTTSPALTAIDGLISTESAPGLYWRVSAPDDLQSQVISRDMLDVLTTYRTSSSTSVGVVFATGGFPEALEAAFKDAHTANGGQTVGFAWDDEVGPGEAIAQAGAGDFDEYLFLASGSEANAQMLLAVSGLSDATYRDKPLFFPDSFRNADTLELAANASAIFPRVRGTAPAPPAGPVFDSFAASYTSSHGEDVRPFSYVANSYDVGWLTAYVYAWAWYQEGGQSGNEIRGIHLARGLRHVSSGERLELRSTNWNQLKASFEARVDVDVVGASGELNYDPVTGETVAPIEVWTIDPSGTSFITEAIVDP